MAGGGEAGVDLSRKFVSEAELDKRRQQRQEEWEKVRKPDDPQGKSSIHSVEGIIPSFIHVCVHVNKSTYAYACMYRRGYIFL